MMKAMQVTKNAALSELGSMGTALMGLTGSRLIVFAAGVLVGSVLF